jgi:hypothetical protein
LRSRWKGKRETLLIPGGDQDLEAERLSRRARAQHGAVKRVARGPQQRERALERIAVPAGRVDAVGCQEPSMKSARTASGNGASSARSRGPAGRPRAESSEPSK